MEDGASQLLDRRRLRTELRDARLASGLTQEQVAKAMEWSLSKMIRIESAQTGISANDLKALLPLYGITDEQQVKRLVGLARAARRRGWWSAYRNVAGEPLLQLIEFESAASVIRQCETQVVPGILQTEEYARAVLEDFYAGTPEAGYISALIELRTRRQELLDRKDPPSMHFRLDEPVIRRLVGTAALMRSQLQTLIEVAAKPNVTIEIMPFSAGLHAGLRGPSRSSSSPRTPPWTTWSSWRSSREMSSPTSSPRRLSTGTCSRAWARSRSTRMSRSASSRTPSASCPEPAAPGPAPDRGPRTADRELTRKTLVSRLRVPPALLTRRSPSAPLAVLRAARQLRHA